MWRNDLGCTERDKTGEQQYVDIPVALLLHVQGFISHVPRPSHPVFVACSANAGEGLVKLSHVQ